MTAKATLTISPRAYRLHLIYPEILPAILAYSAEVITGEYAEWEIFEGQASVLTTAVDYEMGYPAEQPMRESISWQLGGCVTAALVALRLLVLADETEGMRG